MPIGHDLFKGGPFGTPGAADAPAAWLLTERVARAWQTMTTGQRLDRD